MRTMVLALLLVVMPALGGTPNKAPYKKYSKADVIRVYGKPLSLAWRSLAWQANTRLEAAEILHDIYQDTYAGMTKELSENGYELAWENPELVERSLKLRVICAEYASSLDEVIEYYRKVDKR